MPTAAIIYCLATLAPFFMHIGLLFGAPWGHLTMGGRWSGKLPAQIRPLSALQALILILLMAVVLDHAALWDLGLPDWSLWPALFVTLLTTLGNLATPSRPERMLWGPVTAIMSCAILWIAFV